MLFRSGIDPDLIVRPIELEKKTEPATESKANQTESKVRVVSPDGKSGSVPSKNIQYFLNKGYKLVE